MQGRVDVVLAGRVEGPEVVILLALYAFGTGKAALMPFTAGCLVRWLPRRLSVLCYMRWRS